MNATGPAVVQQLERWRHHTQTGRERRGGGGGGGADRAGGERSLIGAGLPGDSADRRLSSPMPVPPESSPPLPPPPALHNIKINQSRVLCYCGLTASRAFLRHAAARAASSVLLCWKNALRGTDAGGRPRNSWNSSGQRSRSAAYRGHTNRMCRVSSMPPGPSRAVLWA